MRTVKFLVFPGAAILDVAGPMQVFRTASLYAVHSGAYSSSFYECSVVSMRGGLVATTVDLPFDTAPAEVSAVDNFIVTGASETGIDAARQDTHLLDYIKAQAATSGRKISMSTGAFMLAEAGLLHGRRATTHWWDCAKLAAEFPTIDVASDAAYVTDGSFWTSAGGLSVVDLALALVEQDLGRSIANVIARIFVLPSRRAAGEPQIGVRLEAHEAELGRIHELMEWITDNLHADLSTPALAEHARLSLRSMHRHFAQQTGGTPAKFVERARVQAAQRLLAKTDESLDAIAIACGFSSSVIMQRAFARVVGTTPANFRRSIRR